MLIFEEMTMTLSGGIAQGTGGARVEINSTIPMYNVGKGDAEVLLKVRMFLQLRFPRVFKCCLLFACLVQVFSLHSQYKR